MQSEARWNDEMDEDLYAEARLYLGTLRTLAQELDRAMESIVFQALPDLCDSINAQAATCTQLSSSPARPRFQRGKLSSFSAPLDAELSGLIEDAVDHLISLNRRYSALVRQSSATVQMLAGCFQPYNGLVGAGSRVQTKLHTWSCDL